MHLNDYYHNSRSRQMSGCRIWILCTFEHMSKARQNITLLTVISNYLKYLNYLVLSHSLETWAHIRTLLSSEIWDFRIDLLWTSTSITILWIAVGWETLWWVCRNIFSCSMLSINVTQLLRHKSIPLLKDSSTQAMLWNSSLQHKFLIIIIIAMSLMYTSQ